VSNNVMGLLTIGAIGLFVVAAIYQLNKSSAQYGGSGQQSLGNAALGSYNYTLTSIFK